MVVIGAGALGLSTALHCALAGRSVVVAERHAAGSQASGRAGGLFKSVQADEPCTTRLARRSIARAVSFAGWAGAELGVARSGSFLIARTAQHREFLRQELAQSRRWGADVREAEPAQLAGLSYYRPVGEQFALWCPEDVYIQEPASSSLTRTWLPAACTARRGDRARPGRWYPGHQWPRDRCRDGQARPVTAPVVVDAAGGWARQVASKPGRWVRASDAGPPPAAHHRASAGGVDPASLDHQGCRCGGLPAPGPGAGGLMAGGFETEPGCRSTPSPATVLQHR